jgi:hypothetical protein
LVRYFGASVPYVTGRWRAGVLDPESARDRAELLLSVEDLLAQHGDRILELLGGFS